MKIFHLADLHLGKKVNEFSMLEEQEYILLQVLKHIDSEQPDALLIAGDVYDKAFPGVEAVEMLNRFLNALAKRKLQTFIISGNHDSAQRLAFAADLIEHSGIHIAHAYAGEVQELSLTDEYGKVHFFMLPFIKPVNVRRYFPEQEIASYDDALKTVIQTIQADTSQRNVLLTHQFVIGGERCESEELSVGGTDAVSAEHFAAFDYVALGHLHAPQQIKRESIRYAGSPLKYSFSEVSHKKSITVITLAQKGKVDIGTIPLTPKHDLKEVRGEYNELMSKAFYQDLNPDDYYHITLTDEEDVPDAIAKLRTVYRKIMKLDYDNRRTRANSSAEAFESAKQVSPIELLNTFYESLNAVPMDENQKAYAMKQIEKIWRDEA